MSNVPKEYDYSQDEEECLRLLRDVTAPLVNAVGLVSRPAHISAEQSPLFGPLESVAELAAQGLKKLRFGPTDFGALGPRE